MSSSFGRGIVGPPPTTAPLSRALGQSEKVQDKVEQAASDLASVNAVLKDEMKEGASPGKVAQALDRSEAVEVKVQEAAVELVSVNHALGQEIGERHLLEQRLERSDAALAKSHASEKRARRDSLHDPVTGLPNLTLFNDRLRKAVAHAKRNGWRLAVMFIDLDQFKNINDTHGHDVGDGILNTVAQRLQGAVRGADSVSRRSGDEFLLLMLEAKDQTSVAAFAQRIAKLIAAPCDVEGEAFAVKASIGVAVYPEDGCSPEDLLKHADLAMYVAKENGSGLAFHGPAEPNTVDRPPQSTH